MKAGRGQSLDEGEAPAGFLSLSLRKDLIQDLHSRLEGYLRGLLEAPRWAFLGTDVCVSSVGVCGSPWVG